jgi:hypothetical protein
MFSVDFNGSRRKISQGLARRRIFRGGSLSPLISTPGHDNFHFKYGIQHFYLENGGVLAALREPKPASVPS